MLTEDPLRGRRLRGRHQGTASQSARSSSALPRASPRRVENGARLQGAPGGINARRPTRAKRGPRSGTSQHPSGAFPLRRYPPAAKVLAQPHHRRATSFVTLRERRPPPPCSKDAPRRDGRPPAQIRPITFPTTAAAEASELLSYVIYAPFLHRRGHASFRGGG